MNPSEVEDPSFSFETIGTKRFKVIDIKGFLGPKVPVPSLRMPKNPKAIEDNEPEDASSEHGGMDHANIVTDDIESMVIDAGVCKVSLEVAKIVVKKLGNEIKQIEADYQCRVTHLTECDLLEIKSANRRNVILAHGDLKELIEDKMASLPPSHFICFPLASPAVLLKVKEFRESLPAAFQQAFIPRDSKIHATICVLTLHTQQAVEAAVTAIDKFRLVYDKPEGAMLMPLKGLYSMSDDSSKTKVVYTGSATPALAGVVNRLGDVLFKCLVEAEATTWDRLRKGYSLGHGNKADIKLHATLINSKYSGKSDFFDARELIDNFSNFNFGTSEISEVRLCEISSADTAIREFYKTIASVKL